MADTFSRLAQAELTTTGSAVALVTAGPSQTIIVRHIRIVNQSSAQSTGVKMWQTGTTNQDVILPTTDISAGGWAEFEGTIILNPTESLSVSKENSTSLTAENLTVTAYGLTMT